MDKERGFFIMMNFVLDMLKDLETELGMPIEGELLMSITKDVEDLHNSGMLPLTYDVIKTALSKLN